MTETKEKSPDYLEVDNPLPGQDWVCMSFISPESMIESKESFKVSKFLESFCKEKELNYQKCMAQYNDFTYKFSDELQKDYDKKVDFKNNIRGVKVRGVFSTRDEADNRAKKLQVLDSDFHVFVGQVGYWLPWDPCADKIENEHFLNDELNEMMVKYKENNGLSINTNDNCELMEDVIIICIKYFDFVNWVYEYQTYKKNNKQLIDELIIEKIEIFYSYRKSVFYIVKQYNRQTNDKISKITNKYKLNNEQSKKENYIYHLQWALSKKLIL